MKMCQISLNRKGAKLKLIFIFLQSGKKRLISRFSSRGCLDCLGFSEVHYVCVTQSQSTDFVRSLANKNVGRQSRLLKGE